MVAGPAARHGHRQLIVMIEGLRRRTPVILAFAVGLAAGLSLLVAFGFVDIWAGGFLIGNDFSAIWAGPRLLVTGGDPYDPNTFRSVSDRLGLLPPATPVYIYPGWVAVVLAPFGALDLATANVVWMAVGLVVASIGLVALLSAGPCPPLLVCTLIGFTLVASESGIVAFYSGQIDFLIVGGLGLMAAWLSRGRLVSAGVAGSVMLLKPQLFVLALPALAVLALARRERRSAYALAGAALALAVVSTIFLPHWWSAWLTHVPATRAADPRAATLVNALRDMFGQAGVLTSYALLAASIAAALAFGRSRAALPVWITVSMSVSPYLWAYDHVVGIVPLAMAALRNGEQSARSAVAVTVVGAVILVVAATLLHAIPGNAHGTLSFNGLAQFALTVLIIASLWRFRTEQVG